MPHAEHDREDLLREATALVERAELQAPAIEAPVVAGFRRDGSFAIFFGGDPVYQFNAARLLRRAFVAGLLYKAERRRLVRLRRERTAAETTLVRQLLGPEEEKAFLVDARERLRALASALQQQQFMLTGQAPPDADVVGRVCNWLSALPPEVGVAESPRSG
jgi:hypothetical protein